ncbi:MAG TPA: CheR family methyltransferase, partial [Geobacteraceae bacterium]|nr:CheR family methyltransferase [Geobacteraceae bacterium]
MSPISKVLLHRQFSGKSASHDVGYHAKPVLLEHEFTLLSSFITQYSGIKVPPAKKTMLESRLAKRLRALRIGSFIEYADYLFSPTAHDREIPLMINAITTNKTEFFREPSHFEYLSASALPELVKRTSRHHQPTIHAWSAGCSSGEEAYTMAMVLSEFTDKYPETVF